MSHPLSEEHARSLRQIQEDIDRSHRHRHESASLISFSRETVAASKVSIATSTRTCAEVREALARTRYGRHRSPRADDDVATTIGAKIAAGRLPTWRPDLVFAGYGDDFACTGCDEPILHAQVEWTLRDDDAVTHRFHVGCFGLWDAELCRRGVRRAPMTA